MRNINLYFLLVGLLVFNLFFSCSSSTKQPSRSSAGGLDKASVHIFKGDDYFFEEKYQQANTSYLKALELEPNNPIAKTGKALSSLKLAYVPQNAKMLLDNASKNTFDSLGEALRDAQTDLEKRKVYNGYIFALTTVQLKGWSSRVEKYKNLSDKLEGGDALETEFHLGLAYAAQYKYSDAIDKLNKVVRDGGQYAKRAENETTLLQKIQRAKPTTKLGNEIAFIDEINKADLAALILLELDLNRLSKKQGLKPDHSFQEPQEQTRKTIKEKRTQLAIDVEGHPLQEIINESLELRIRGLEVDSSSKFYPDKFITKAEFAVILEDILIRMQSEEQLATKYIGEESPFPDVSPDKWYYNAARVTTERQILPIGNEITGKFHPLSGVTGADALLALSLLKDSGN